jgi:glyoxylase-like metal-dependent hydrolase (beta-lactamase superfamily II)
MGMLLAVVGGSLSARQNQDPGQNDGQPGHKIANGETVVPRLLPACSLLPAGGVCLDLDNGEVQLLHVQDNVYMIGGAGANITVQVGDEVVMVVDTGLAEMSDKVITAIQALTDKPILFVISTSMDEDHTGGNANLSKAGWALPNSSSNPISEGQDIPDKTGLTLPAGAPILAHINVLNRMSAPTGQKAPVSEDRWPTDTYETDSWRLYNGEGVYIYHVPAAHTDGDSIVFFRRSDVVSTGDLFTTLGSYPVIDLQKGGSIDGFVDGLNQIIELLEPRENEEGGTYVIPGHGHISDRNDVVNYRDMVTIIRGRIGDMVKEGKTLEQVKAAKPTLDYDGLYGATTGPWTTDMFIEAVYRDLSKPKDQHEGHTTGMGGGE